MHNDVEFEMDLLLCASRAGRNGPVGFAINQNPTSSEKPACIRMKMCLLNLVNRGLLRAWTHVPTRTLTHEITRAGWLHLRARRVRLAT